jgi:hypothetical protein
MEQVIDFISRWLRAFFDVVWGLLDGVIGIFAWPAEIIGVQPGLLFVAMLCLGMLALWRAMGGYFD